MGDIQPIWKDGEPMNLQAAGFDAMAWLVTVRARLAESSLVWANMPELNGCISALERFLPEEIVTAREMDEGGDDGR